MNYTNRMVSSDNMGYASYLLEQDKNPTDLPGQVRGAWWTDQGGLPTH